MNTKEKIEIMQAFVDGKDIEFKRVSDTKYKVANIVNVEISWNWMNYARGHYAIWESLYRERKKNGKF